MISWLKAEYRRRARVEWFGRALAIAREEKRRWHQRFENGVRCGVCSIAYNRGYYQVAKKIGSRWVVIEQRVLVGAAIDTARKEGK